MRAYIALIRPLFTFRNLLWFLLGSVRSFGHSPNWLNLLLSFISYMLLWFSVYILDDLLDAEEDKNLSKIYAEKQENPLASGTISRKLAKTLLASFLIISVMLASLISPPSFFFVILATILVVALYNLPPFKGQHYLWSALILLWLMQALKILAGLTAAGYHQSLPLGLFLALPTLYLFHSHYYWERTQRFPRLRVSKWLTAALTGLFSIFFLLWIRWNLAAIVLLVLLIFIAFALLYFYLYRNHSTKPVLFADYFFTGAFGGILILLVYFN